MATHFHSFALLCIAAALTFICPKHLLISRIICSLPYGFTYQYDTDEYFAVYSLYPYIRMYAILNEFNQPKHYFVPFVVGRVNDAELSHADDDIVVASDSYKSETGSVSYGI
jgi:hypothetical protein